MGRAVAEEAEAPGFGGSSFAAGAEAPSDTTMSNEIASPVALLVSDVDVEMESPAQSESREILGVHVRCGCPGDKPSGNGRGHLARDNLDATPAAEQARS